MQAKSLLYNAFSTVEQAFSLRIYFCRERRRWCITTTTAAADAAAAMLTIMRTGVIYF